MTPPSSIEQSLHAVEIFFISTSTLPDGTTLVDWVGSAMIWTLVAMSLGSVGLIARALLAHRPHSVAPEGAASALVTRAHSATVTELRSSCAADNSDLGRITRAALDALPLGRPGTVDAAESAAEECAARRFRSIESLNILAQVSPMIGLFGTVYGMIVAFQTVAATGGQADPALLAGGIGTALVTTFWGLIIAIPALLTYAVVRNRIDAEVALALETALRVAGDLVGRGEGP
ncbi:MAG: MotA/TolQ/ExbB proton channel family protein [Phycisphaerales bacterium]|nr:MotA/TolQ/ExbB proton channel family protein [Phycisphaerales bacterium]